MPPNVQRQPVLNGPEVYPTKGQDCDFCERPHGDVFEIRDRHDKARNACIGCIESVLLKVISLLTLTSLSWTPWIL